MQLTQTEHEVSPPLAATALIVDLRNFTASLNASSADTEQRNRFYQFLSEFYAICVDACLMALPPESRLKPPLYLNSTGDGVLIVYLCEAHVRCGFLAALLMNLTLQSMCESYNATSQAKHPKVSFGIGVESGVVSYISASAPLSGQDATNPVVDTYIGECINVAARAEAMSKVFYGARTIIARGTNEFLCAELFGENYSALIRDALDVTLPDDKRLAVHDKMNDLNRRLCLTFIHHHNLRGVDEPMPLFRIADSSAVPGNPRFESLMASLNISNEHGCEVHQFLNSHANLD
jgi:class 3 adenylate cyclase